MAHKPVQPLEPIMIWTNGLRLAALFLNGSVLLLLMWFGTVPAWATGTNIAILKSSDLSAYSSAVDGFRSELPSKGMTLQEYDLHDDLEQGRQIARKIRLSETTLVLAVGLKAALAAKREIADIPIVYCMVLDPDKHGLASAHLSGISLEIPFDRYLTAMRTLLPELKRIGVLYDPTKTGRVIQEAQGTAKRRHVQLVAQAVSSQRDLPPTLRALLHEVDAIWLAPDTTVLNDESLPYILQESFDAGRPVFGSSSEFVKLGALLSLSADYGEIGKQSAQLAMRILTEQVRTPVHSHPEQLHLAINLKSARFLGITVPSAFERQADQRY